MTSQSDDATPEQVLGPREFTEELAERIEQVPGVSQVARDRLALRLRWQGRPIAVELDHFYNAYRRAPSQIEAIASALIQAVRTQGPGRSPTSFDEIKARICPMLKPVELLVEVAERDIPMLVYRPFLADLIIAYVIDEERSVAYINEDHLKVWGVTEETLYQHALENLRRRTVKPDTLTIVGDAERRLLIYNTGDGYDATRLLLTELIQEWAAMTPARLVLGIPNRDFLIGFSDADPNIFRQIVTQISVDATHREYGLTDQLFTIVNGRIGLYEYISSSSEQL